MEERGWAYRRRQPEGTVLYEAVRENLATLLAEASDVGRGLPRYVERDFARYLECGVLVHGFARVRCESCKDELLVAFSCKGRGVWEVQVLEPLPAAPAQRLAPVELELRERVRLTRDGLWRPEAYPVPTALPRLAAAREEPPTPARPSGPASLVDDRPVPPMLHVEQLGLFGDTA